MYGLESCESGRSNLGKRPGTSFHPYARRSLSSLSKVYHAVNRYYDIGMLRDQVITLKQWKRVWGDRLPTQGSLARSL